MLKYTHKQVFKQKLSIIHEKTVYRKKVKCNVTSLHRYKTAFKPIKTLFFAVTVL